MKRMCEEVEEMGLICSLGKAPEVLGGLLPLKRCSYPEGRILLMPSVSFSSLSTCFNLFIFLSYHFPTTQHLLWLTDPHLGCLIYLWLNHPYSATHPRLHSMLHPIVSTQNQEDPFWFKSSLLLAENGLQQAEIYHSEEDFPKTCCACGFQWGLLMCFPTSHLCTVTASSMLQWHH